MQRVLNPVLAAVVQLQTTWGLVAHSRPALNASAPSEWLSQMVMSADQAPDNDRYSTGGDGTKGIWCNEIEYNGTSNKICLGIDQHDRCVTVLNVTILNQVPNTSRIGSFCLFWDPSTKSYDGTWQGTAESRISSIEFLTESIYDTSNTGTDVRLVVGFTRGVYAISLEKKDLLETFKNGVILDKRAPWTRVSPEWDQGCLMERFHIGRTYPRFFETIRCDPEEPTLPGKPTLHIRSNIALSPKEDSQADKIFVKTFGDKREVGPKGMCELSKREVLVTMPALKGFDLVYVRLCPTSECEKTIGKGAVKRLTVLKFKSKDPAKVEKRLSNWEIKNKIGKIQDCIVLQGRTRNSDGTVKIDGKVGLMSRNKDLVFVANIKLTGKKVIFKTTRTDEFKSVKLPYGCGCHVVSPLLWPTTKSKYFAYGCEWTGENGEKDPDGVFDKGKDQKWWGGFLRMNAKDSGWTKGLQELGKKARVGYDKACLQQCFHEECGADEGDRDASCPASMSFGPAPQLGQ